MVAVAVLLLAVLCGATIGHGAEWYVATNGSDRNLGTKEAPLATLQGARNAIRKAKAAGSLPVGGITVWIRGGEYPINATFELLAEDSGTTQSPITYRAMPGETVRLSGGRRVEKFVPVTDPATLRRLPPEAQGCVLQCDLRAQGINTFGTMAAQGFSHPNRPAAMELFFNDQPMTLARWPNSGFATYGAVVDKGSVPRNRDPDLPKAEQNFEPPRPGRFIYTGERPSRWVGAKDVWLFGYWAYDWADETIALGAIDPAKHEITLAAPHTYGVQPTGRFVALNLLEELDTPGEYYIDRPRGVLYFWPPAPVATGRAVVSMLAEPMIALDGASYIILRDLILEDSRSYGIYIAGGSNNLVDGCTIRNLGDLGVTIGEGAEKRQLGMTSSSCFARLYKQSEWNRNAGTNNGVSNCEIYNLGAEGVALGGGDRKTLTPAGNFVVNCDIHHVARWIHQSRPPIFIDGVGNRAAHNLIHDVDASAIMFWGNDHLMEFNEIHHCVTDSTDAGAIYTGRDPSGRGNLIRYNFIHHIGPPTNRNYGAQAVFLDDGASGQMIFGNVFYKAGTNGVVKFNGGYDNEVENNLVIDCPPFISGWVWKNAEWNAFVRESLLQRRLREAVDITRPPYSTCYPKLASVLDDRPDVVRANRVENNYVTSDLGEFVDGAKMNFALKADAAVWKKLPQFKPIPFDQIGRQRDVAKGRGSLR